MVLPDSHRVSRVRCYLGGCLEVLSFSLTGLSPSMAVAFQQLSANSSISYFYYDLYLVDDNSRDPEYTTHRGLTCIRFRLFPLRSPLLRESLLLSFPRDTKMFQFSPFASPPYTFRWRCQNSFLAGCPIRISTDLRSLTAPRGFSQSTTSFVASWRLNIPHILLLTYHLPRRYFYYPTLDIFSFRRFLFSSRRLLFSTRKFFFSSFWLLSALSYI